MVSLFFFFFKQKTAYEMRISDWSSDVCSSDLLTLGTTRDQIVRAAMESLAHQCRDLMEAFAADGAAWQSLRIDGGMSANDWMAQDLADMLDLPVERPAEDRKSVV